jgi:hypothetical protein
LHEQRPQAGIFGQLWNKYPYLNFRPCHPLMTKDG